MSQQTFTPSSALAAMASGDEAGFELIYEATSGVVYSLAVRISGDAEAAASACEAAYADLWNEGQAAGSTVVAGSADVQAWLLARVRRYALGTAEIGVDQSVAANSAYLEARAADGPGASEIGALDSLEGLQRRALELAYFGGLTVDGIAEILCEPVAGIRGALREGMLKLAVITRDAAPQTARLLSQSSASSAPRSASGDSAGGVR